MRVRSRFVLPLLAAALSVGIAPALIAPPMAHAAGGDDTPTLLNVKGEHESGDDESSFDKLRDAYYWSPLLTKNPKAVGSPIQPAANGVPGTSNLSTVGGDWANQGPTPIVQVGRTSNTFDYAVQELKQEPSSQGRTRAVVVAQRLGEATFPVDVVTTFADGQQATEHWDGKDRRVIYTYERPARVTRVEIDPGHVLLLDINRTNNSCTTQPRADAAARKWSLAWMVWMLLRPAGLELSAALSPSSKSLKVWK